MSNFNRQVHIKVGDCPSIHFRGAELQALCDALIEYLFHSCELNSDGVPCSVNNLYPLIALCQLIVSIYDGPEEHTPDWAKYPASSKTQKIINRPSIFSLSPEELSSF